MVEKRVSVRCLSLAAVIVGLVLWASEPTRAGRMGNSLPMLSNGAAWAVPMYIGMPILNGVKWTHLSSMKNQVPAPDVGRQVATLILDVDKDGVNDFLVASYEKIAWFRHVNGGRTRYAIENGAQGVRIEAGGDFFDIDGDGDLDILEGAQSKVGEIWWWENPYPDFQADKPWKRHQVIAVGGTHHDQIFGDFDGDGRTELAFWYNVGKQLYLAEIPADPTQAWPVTQIAQLRADKQRPEGLAKLDINGDGFIDIAIGGAKGPLVWYAYPDWKKRLVAEGGYQTVEGEAADIDQDGDQDIVMGGIVWYENPGPTVQSTDRPWKAHRVAQVRIHDVEVGDLDGDGKLDIVSRNQSSFSNPSGNKFYVWKQQTPDKWSGHEIECPHGEGIKLSDLDRDGDLDVVIGARWYENTGNILEGPWTEHVYSTSWKHPDTEVQCYDLNDDGRVDIILTPAELKGNQYRISWFEAPRDAKSPDWREHVIEEKQETVVHSLGVADMNNDGKLDVVIAEMHQGDDPDEVRVYLNQGGGLKWTRQVISTTGSHDIVVADIGADGDIDVVGANHAGSIQAVHLWENLNQHKRKG